MRALRLCAPTTGGAAVRKRSGVAPSVAAVLDKCPQATENPGTGEPFTPKHTYEAFRSYCYDEGSVMRTVPDKIVFEISNPVPCVAGSTHRPSAPSPKPTRESNGTRPRRGPDTMAL